MQLEMGSARASRAVVGALAGHNNTHEWFTFPRLGYARFRRAGAPVGTRAPSGVAIACAPQFQTPCA
jgi:hypothetical protein